jgi:putative membrane protein
MTMDQSNNPPGPATAETGGGDLRFYFAGERTMLAWIRTSVSLMALGFVMARFSLFLREVAAHGSAVTPAAPAAPQGPSMSLWIGVVLIFAGVALCAMAGREYARFRKRFVAGVAYELPPLGSALVLCLGMAGLGTLMAVYLVTLAL